MSGMQDNAARIAMKAQKVEITESVISIGAQEKQHAAIWRKAAGAEARPSRLKVFWVVLLARTFGLTFVLKRMERKEGTGSRYYDGLAAEFPQARKLGQEEAKHEKALLNMLDEELLQYVGSIVLKRRFLEMGAISLGVAAFSFFIGFLLKKALGIEA